jgi:hypothetical protein
MYINDLMYCPGRSHTELNSSPLRGLQSQAEQKGDRQMCQGQTAQECLHDFHNISTHPTLTLDAWSASHFHPTPTLGLSPLHLIGHDMLSDIGRTEPFIGKTLKRRP